MDQEAVAKRTAALVDLVDDPEVCHARLDALVEEILVAVAAGHPDAAELAKAALVALEVRDQCSWWACA